MKPSDKKESVPTQYDRGEVRRLEQEMLDAANNNVFTAAPKPSDAMSHPKKWAHTKQRNDLKVCPFCGTKAIEQARLADNTTDMHWRISCGNPFCELDCATKIFAAKADAERVWQERTL